MNNFPPPLSPPAPTACATPSALAPSVAGLSTLLTASVCAAWRRALLMRLISLLVLSCCCALSPAQAQGQEAQIRKNLMERIPQFPKIEEVTRAAMTGLFEVRVEGDEIYYTDADASYLIQGSLIDTKTRRNLTEERVDKLTAVDFRGLPFKDSITLVHGSGKRQLAIFEDPNCGYCKRFEKDLQKIDNVTVHLFLYPVLGQDSIAKAKTIWCAKDRAKTWTDWMQKESLPNTSTASGAGNANNSTCDTQALQRIVEFGKKHKINGTPTLITQDGTRVPGAINANQIERLLTDGKF